MAMQMYIVTFKGGFSQDSSRDVQRYVRQLGGYILMVSPNGPLIALDDSLAPKVASHPLVEHLGGVTLDPRGRAAQYLQRLFAENLSKQIAFEPESSVPEPEGGRYVRRSRPA
jgi:hypothetical protein